MQVVGVFMAFNANYYDVKQYQFKWLKVLSYVERNLGSSFVYAKLCVILIVYYFDITIDNIILELQELL